MNNKIDIVIRYLNDNDEIWQQEYNYWKNKEIKEGKAKLSNRQAFGKERIRDWDTFKYVLRSIEKNCSWINKIFIIVQNERHIPKWLDINNSKIRIVYHDEFMPKELLPTFNSMAIAMYVSNIKDLSENYIMCDDDFYFLNKIAEDRFFKRNKPVHLNNRIAYGFYKGNYLLGTDNTFYHILNNNFKIEIKYRTKKIKYGFYHLPSARNKSFENKILKENEIEILKRFSCSKFRNSNNVCHNLYDNLLKICGVAIIEDPYKNCSYCTLKSTVDFEKYRNKDIVCFNDTEQLDDYEKTKEKFIMFLDSIFPNKCSFEKE